jgi:arylsulfatase
VLAVSGTAEAAEKKPNIVMLMQDDTGWTDFGAYLGGAALGHPTPNVDSLAKEGVMFTSWYGQASCTAGRASFMTGRIPIRSALSIVVAPGDENHLRKQTPTIAELLKKHAEDDKPLFMDVNFMKMHNPNNPAKEFAGKSRLGRYSDSLIEMDHNIGLIMAAINKHAPNTIVITTADNGAWQDAFLDAGTNPFRGEKGTTFEAGWRVPGIMWWPDHIPAGEVRHEMMTHIDLWSTLASMVGIKPPPHGEWKDNNGKPIYFDSIDNSAYVLGKAKHSARKSWIYIDGETFGAVRVDICGDKENADICIPWKYTWTMKDTWLGAEAKLGSIGSLYNLALDPYEKYDMIFNGAQAARLPKSSPGQYAGMDNGWMLAAIYPVLIEFDKSIIKYPNIKRYPGGASKDLMPDLTKPENPVPALDPDNPPQVQTTGG